MLAPFATSINLFLYLLQSLIDKNLFTVFPVCLQAPDVRVRLHCLELGGLLLSQYPEGMVNHVVFEGSLQANFLLLFVKCLVEDPEAGVKTHAAELLLQLLEPENLDVRALHTFLC
jgi:hypothetical protein